MTLLKMFMTFLKIGAFTFGGGYAMIPLIQVEVVDKNKWLEKEEFVDIIAIAQSAPGPIAVNASIFVGFKIKRIIGSLLCMTGVIIPSFVVILLIAAFFYQFRENELVKQVFLGIKPAVVALIAIAAYRFSNAIKLKIKSVLIAIVSLVLVVFFDVTPVLIILASALGSICLFKLREKRHINEKSIKK